MLITTPWLLQHLESPIAHDALMEAFPKIGLEIEESSKLESGEGFRVDLNVLANRPDMLGVIGIAREVAAHFKTKLKYPAIPKSISDDRAASPVTVEIRDADLCPRYIGRVFKNVKVGPSPKWLTDILIALDQRPINNVVDITNFVMLETGQPLHAFDFAKIGGKKIVVRKLAANEKLELLGGKTIDAGKSDAPPTLAICDAERPIALAGIMGGKDSETREGSTEILLEAAHFDPPTVRRTAKRIELSSASSFRFERGGDPNRMLEFAMQRAAALLVELASATPVGAAVDAYPKRVEPRTFSLSTERVSSYLGTPVDSRTIRESLQRLEMTVADNLAVTVPTWRRDAVDPVVLIEDIARSVGYDDLPMRPTSQSPTPGKRSALDDLRQQLASYLSSSGFFEARSPSLDTAEQIEALDSNKQSLVRLKNPMSRELAVMRTSLLPALARVAERNTRRGATTTRFFEMDRAYRKATNDPNQPGAIEQWMIAGVAGGMANEFDWSGKNTPIDFYAIKGAVEDLIELAHVGEATFQPAARAGFVAGTCAAIEASGAVIGHVGQIDSGVIDLGKMTFKLYGFELDLAVLLKTHDTVSVYRQLSRTPAVWRDLAIIAPAAKNFADIERAIRESAGETLESLRIVDLYQGKQIAENHRSLAFRLTFRDAARTLTADEVQQHVERVVGKLKSDFGATLRE